MVSVILQNEKDGKTTVQKDNTVTQKDNKHTRKMSKDTPKYSKLTPKNPREQGSKLLKENGSDISESVSEKACKRGRAEKKKSALAQKFRKILLEPKIKIRGASEGADGLRTPHALQKEIKYFKNSLPKSLTFSEIEFIIILSVA